MPKAVEHIRCCKKLLGKSNPLVHKFMDMDVKILGPKHRYLTHHNEFLDLLGNLWGRDAKIEAVFHILQDCGIITKKDYSYQKTPWNKAKR